MVKYNIPKRVVQDDLETLAILASSTLSFSLNYEVCLPMMVEVPNMALPIGLPV